MPRYCNTVSVLVCQSSRYSSSSSLHSQRRFRRRASRISSCSSSLRRSRSLRIISRTFLRRMFLSLATVFLPPDVLCLSFQSGQSSYPCQNAWRILPRNHTTTMTARMPQTGPIGPSMYSNTSRYTGGMSLLSSQLNDRDEGQQAEHCQYDQHRPRCIGHDSSSSSSKKRDITHIKANTPTTGNIMRPQMNCIF